MGIGVSAMGFYVQDLIPIQKSRDLSVPLNDKRSERDTPASGIPRNLES